jgi:hypothetical protein
MKAPGLLPVPLALLIAVSTAAQAASPEIEQLRQEIRELRLEVLQQKAETQQWKVQSLMAWLQQIQGERQRAASQVQAIRQELVEMELASAAAQDDQKAELGGLKEKLSADQLPNVERALESLIQRESELTAELGRERERLAATQEQIQRIGGKARGSR